MSRTYTCYLQKTDVLTPELRILACASEDLLPDLIQSQLETWGKFDAVDIYSDADEALFRFTTDGRLIQ